MTGSSISFHARCHCGNTRIAQSLPHIHSKLLKSSLCHCVDCRRSTGSLIAAWAVIPASPPETSGLREYESSKVLKRYFCGCCGASVCNIEGTQWGLATGLIEDLDHSLLDRIQLFSRSGRDGGASVWLPRELYGRTLERLSHDRNSEIFSDTLLAATAHPPYSDSPTRLNASCHCGAIQFYLERPNSDAQDSKNSDQKYKAAPCPCQSCRLTSGQEFIAWCYVPSTKVRSLDGSPFNINHPGLVHYSSSTLVDRTFCQTCGAKVFYRRLEQDKKPEQWDIAVGLFTADCTRLEDWLDWDPKELAFGDEAVDKILWDALAKGILTRYQNTATGEGVLPE